MGKELKVSYPVATEIMKILVRQGQAKMVANVFPANLKGRPTRVFSVPNQVKIKIPKSKSQYRLVGSRLVQYKKAV